ncbi:MAG: alpha/beta hydrolase, partial [Bradyrhizobium sp.]|nr:alpha/beta hydrolase [Bradyrhizobium sp.]
MRNTSTRARIWLEGAGGRIAVARWGDAKSNMPPVLLVHGTGFVAETWEDVACVLASNHVVYAFDRRGHGASHKPEMHQYHFMDFAQDACAVIEALQLSGVIGVGHSAGGTDLLLAAKLLPDHFSRLFVIEPTVMDPRADKRRGGTLSDESKAALEQIRRRRPEFPSAAAAFQRLRTAPVFSDWSERALSAYLQYGFESLEDGSVRLLCTPDIEAAMLVPICEAIDQIYTGDERGNPFSWLSEIRCPVRVSTTERSAAIHKI